MMENDTSTMMRFRDCSREYAEEVNSTAVKHRVAEIHARRIQRSTKKEALLANDVRRLVKASPRSLAGTGLPDVLCRWPS